MTPPIATLLFAIGILGLFLLDRDRKARTSKALWLPVVWLLIVGSRPVSMWLGMAPLLESPDQYLEGSPLDRSVFIALLALGLIVLIGRRRQIGAVLRANAPILLFFFYCALSIFWSDYPFVAFKRWTKAVGDLVMVMVVLTDPDRSAAVKRLLAWTAFLLIPLSVLLIKYYPDLGRGYSPWTWTYYYTGVTTGKNLLGMICLILGLGSVWRFLTANRGRHSRQRTGQLIAHGIVLAMVVWLFWMINSLTSLSCFLLAGGFMTVTSLRTLARKPAVAHLLLVGVVSVSLFALFFDSGGGLVGTLGRDATLTGRTAIWKLVLGMTGNRLVGTGFESFWLGERLKKMWNIYWFHANEAHNGYLEVFLNLGWIGLALLALLMVTGYRNVFAALRRDPELSRLGLAYFVVAVIYNFTEAGFRMMTPVWIFFLLAATRVPEAAVHEADISARVQPEPSWAELPAAGTPIYGEVV